MYTRKLLVTLLGLSLVTGATTVGAASASDFKDTEYYASGGLDIINAADAYALGYTGKGSYVGISDYPVNFLHPEFNTKANSSMLNMARYNGGPLGVYDWSVLGHGSHVAGIAAGSRNGLGMQGVAYDAAISGLNNCENFSSGTYVLGPDIYGPVLANQALKAINCSWDPSDNQQYYYPDVMGYNVSKNFIVNDTCHYTGQVLNAVQADKLLLFAAGNNGHTTTQISGLLGSFLPEAANNILMVTLLNNEAIQKDEDGSMSTPEVLGCFSDGTKYAEDFSLSAPGQNIISVEADFAATGTQYVKLSGTSMATPYVTGAAAVVQQAFPYMSARQLGDVLLSTANSKVTSTTKMQITQEDMSGGISSRQVNIYYLNDGTQRTETELNDDRAAYLKKIMPTSWSYESEWNEWLGYNRYNVYYNVPMQELIGQGVLDVGAAVQGPGALNVRRMTNSALSSDYTVAGVAGKQALYTVNTAGYNSHWSNNIKEIKSDYIASDSSEADLRERWLYYDTNWLSYTGTDRDTAKATTEAYVAAFNQKVDESGLRNLHAGLYKTGEGILRLTGHNTYQGSSIAAGGTLAIDGSVTGDAYSTGSGVLAGTGTIGGNLYNQGTLRPGTYAVNTVFDTNPAYSQGTLHVQGNLNSTGNLQIAVNGTSNSKLEVSGTSTLTGTTLSLLAGSTVPLVNYQYTYLNSQGGITGNATAADISPYLALTSKVDGNAAYFTANQQQTLGGLSGMTPSEHSVGAALNKLTLQTVAQAPTATQAQALNSLLYQEEAASRKFTKQVTSEARAQLLNQSPMSSLTNDTVYSRLDTVDVDGLVMVNANAASMDGDAPQVKTTLPVSLDANNNVWFKLFRGFETYNGTGDNYDLHNKSFGGAIGYDHAVSTTTRIGGLFSYGKTDYSTDNLNGKSHDWRVGFYGDHKNGNWEYQGLLSYGQNHYDLDRYTAYDGSTLNSDYKAKVWDVEAKAKYLIPSTARKVWQLKPYGILSYTHTSQDDYKEIGTSLLGQNQSMDSATNNSWRGEVGLEFKRNITKRSGWSGSVGYKRVISGANPELNGSFSGDNSFTLSTDNDKNYLTYSLSAHGPLGGRWTGQAEFKGEKSQNNHKEIYSVIAKYAF